MNDLVGTVKKWEEATTLKLASSSRPKEPSDGAADREMKASGEWLGWFSEELRRRLGGRMPLMVVSQRKVNVAFFM